MNTDQGRIRRVENCDITSRPSLSILKFRILIGIGAAALEKLQERLVGSVVVHFFQDLVDLGTEVTLAEFPLLSTQLFSLQLSGTDVMLSQQGPYFGGRPWINSAPSSTGASQTGSCLLKMRPPMRSRASRIVTLSPAWESSAAADSPAAPAPRIIMMSGLGIALAKKVEAPARDLRAGA